MKALVWASIDTLSCLLLVILAALNPPPDPSRSAIQTYGRWAVVVTWEASRDDDVDTWVRDPLGNRVWFGDRSAGSMNLEHDDLGTFAPTEEGVRENRERVVLRGVVPGEYVANVHGYNIREVGPARVRIELWRLQGRDQRVYVREVDVAPRGEVTAFRFTLGRDGALRDVNTLPAVLVTTR